MRDKPGRYNPSIQGTRIPTSKLGLFIKTLSHKVKQLMMHVCEALGSDCSATNRKASGNSANGLHYTRRSLAWTHWTESATVKTLHWRVHTLLAFLCLLYLVSHFAFQAMVKVDLQLEPPGSSFPSSLHRSGNLVQYSDQNCSDLGKIFHKLNYKLRLICKTSGNSVFLTFYCIRWGY